MAHGLRELPHRRNGRRDIKLGVVEGLPRERHHAKKKGAKGGTWFELMRQPTMAQALVPWLQPVGPSTGCTTAGHPSRLGSMGMGQRLCSEAATQRLARAEHGAFGGSSCNGSEEACEAARIGVVAMVQFTGPEQGALEAVGVRGLQHLGWAVPARVTPGARCQHEQSGGGGGGGGGGSSSSSLWSGPRVGKTATFGNSLPCMLESGAEGTVLVTHT